MTADVSRNSFDPTNNYKEFIFQKARDVVDDELNSLQKMNRYDRATVVGDRQQGAVTSTSLQVLGSGLSQDVTIQAGMWIVGGTTFYLGSDTLLSTLMGSANPLTTNGGAARYDYVYVDFQEEIVDAGTDPTIAVDSLGETTQRRRLRATWGVSLGSYPGAAPGAGTLWANGVVRFVMARVWRPTATANVALGDVLDLRNIPKSIVAQMDANAAVGLTSEGYVSWTPSTGVFAITAPAASTTEGLNVSWQEGGSYLVNGSWTIPAGYALVLFPQRYGSRRWGSVLRVLLHDTSTTAVVDPTTNVTQVLPIASSYLRTDGTHGFVLAMRPDSSSSLILNHGKVLAKSANTSTSVFTGTWSGDSQRERHEHVVFTIGDGTNSFGMFNGADSFVNVLGGLIPVLASTTNRMTVTIKLKAGLHTTTPLGSPGAQLVSFTSSGKIHLIIDGDGVDETQLDLPRTNCTVAGLYLPEGAADGSKLTMRGLTLLDSGSGNVPTVLVETGCDTRFFEFNTSEASIKVVGANAPQNRHSAQDCNFTGSSTANVHALEYYSVENNGYAEVSLSRCQIKSVGGNGYDGLRVTAVKRTVITDCQFFNTTANANSACFRSKNSVDGFCKDVELLGCTFTTTANGGKPVSIEGGERIKISKCVDANDGSHSWTAGPRVYVSPQKSSSSQTVTRSIDVSGNLFEVSGSVSGYGVVTIACGGTDGMTDVFSLHVDDNAFVGLAGVGTATGDFIAVNIGLDAGGGTMRYHGGSVARNMIDLTLATGATAGHDLIVIDGNGNTAHSTTNYIYNLAVTENTIYDPYGSSAASSTTRGVYVAGPARQCRVSDNSIQLLSTGLGGGGSKTDGVHVASNARDILLQDNWIQAEYPCDLTTAVGCYGHGNHVVRCANTGARNIAASSTFAAGDQKVA